METFFITIDDTVTVTLNNNTTNPKNEWNKKRKRARYKLLSIYNDSIYLSTTIQKHHKQTWPILPNERCGSWYINNKIQSIKSCYFKSTDGHVNTWNFSFKRLNLGVVEIINKSGGCFIIDSSKRKELPDSFARTIPIWCYVLNQLTLYYHSTKVDDDEYCSKQNWKSFLNRDLLFTPPFVDTAERNLIKQKTKDVIHDIIINNIIDSNWLLQTMNKPIRIYWISNPDPPSDIIKYDVDNYNCIVCINCSNIHNSCIKWYTPGAADDHESWSKGLTPNLFWSNAEYILGKEIHSANELVIKMPLISSNEIDKKIGIIVRNAMMHNEEWYNEANNNNLVNENMIFNAIGKSGISIGTRSAGKPPKCWIQFDTILNVSTMEYEQFVYPSNNNNNSNQFNDKYYLCCPVKEGKKDKLELERWMTVAIVFIISHLLQGRKVLVHCAQGMDRSVAVVLTTILLFCCFDNDMELYSYYHSLPFITSLETFVGIYDTKEIKYYRYSGLREELVFKLMGRNGRNILFDWIYQQYRIHHNGNTNDSMITTVVCDKDHQPLFANKELIRKYLHFIQRYHDRASPSRNTMQKLNRYFMSSCYE